MDESNFDLIKRLGGISNPFLINAQTESVEHQNFALFILKPNPDDFKIKPNYPFSKYGWKW
jgi:hypothetical protein